jgi:hypothetical protein
MALPDWSWVALAEQAAFGPGLLDVGHGLGAQHGLAGASSCP